MTFEEYWSILDEAGWFLAYSDATRVQFRETLTRYWTSDPHLIVYGLGRPAYDSEWTAEYRDFPRMAVKSFATLSDGHFAPQDIIYEYFKKGERHCRLAFTHAGHRVSADFVYLGGELEPAITRLCNQAMELTGSPYRFFDVESPDQCAYVALATPQAFEAISARGFLRVRELPGNRWGAIIE